MHGARVWLFPALDEILYCRAWAGFPRPSNRGLQTLELRMTEETAYTPPQVWKWIAENGGKFASTNRPIAGSTHEQELPVGDRKSTRLNSSHSS